MQRRDIDGNIHEYQNQSIDVGEMRPPKTSTMAAR